LAQGDGPGIMWEDPREIHEVIVHFAGPAPAPDKVRLEYWGSHWPEQHLPKDREPGGADVGWMELGNWYQGGWRVADTDAVSEGRSLKLTFRPVNQNEFPKVQNYAAKFRYTLKLRVASHQALPKIEKFEAFTDSLLENRRFRMAWKTAPANAAQVEVFNGTIAQIESGNSKEQIYKLQTTTNSDPNTFDRTLVTVRNGKDVFTFKVDDLAAGALFLPQFNVAVTAPDDRRKFSQIATAKKAQGAKTLYDRVGEMPEQTWSNAWTGLPRKKSDIDIPLGLDGGRQRFGLSGNGAIWLGYNARYLRARRGRDTPRLDLEPTDEVWLYFGLPARPVFRTLEERSLPICETTWETNGLRITETAFATELEAAKAEGPIPAADAFAVFLARFVITNLTQAPQTFSLPLDYRVKDGKKLRMDAQGSVWLGDNLRAQFIYEPQIADSANSGAPSKKLSLAPGEAKSVVLKFPYLVLTEPSEHDALYRLDFDKEFQAVRTYWHRRLDESSKLITPEPMLNEFYRAHAGHLLINCECEPGSERRFARVGSFNYGVYGNESCMMVVDLDRRGYHKEAQECLDAWLHYQSTVALPGDFASKDGVLYGAGGYEAGGYNQHHGWILWCIAEHYRFTRDEAWLRQAASGIVAGADWLIRETKRTSNGHELEKGLLPAGSLEDIGDWWPWLSTSCYSWRGLDSAAWALEQMHHPEAGRIRAEASLYHSNLLANFRKASERSPVVRLRDGTAIPQIPSQVHRRGRSFGWICQTLEGPMHLLITGALDPRCKEATNILKDYEDNLYLSNQYGYTVDNFEERWFGRGGMSMQACLLLDVEPYLYRDDVKHALRALFNAEAVSYFPDVRMNTEHAAPYFDDWRGDHYKSSDEANACGWLRQLFVREDGDTLLIGQAIPRYWLKPGQMCGLERAATYYGPMNISYIAGANRITAKLDAPQRNPPKTIRLRFRTPEARPLLSVTVNGKKWKRFSGDWVELPGNVKSAEVVGAF